MTHIAYFYDKQSAPVGGWKDRTTVACDENGRIESPAQYEKVRNLTFIGYWKRREEPEDAWLPAWAGLGKQIKQQTSCH